MSDRDFEPKENEKEKTPTRQTIKDRLFNMLFSAGCLLPFIIGALFPIIGMLVGVWKLCNGNIGFFILNILMIPFIIIGGINTFRGIFTIMEEDGAKYRIKDGWRFYAYLLITTAGYLTFFLAVMTLWNR